MTDCVEMVHEQSQKPLVVDLDGTLLKSDLLYESYFSSLHLGAGHHLGVIQSLLKGKAQLKAMLADACHLKYASIPQDSDVLELIRDAKSAGRRVYLATASDMKHAKSISDHLGCFDGIFASDGKTNLSGRFKAERLCAEFGPKGFDYIGNDAADLFVWKVADRSFAVRADASLKRRIAVEGLDVRHLDEGRPKASLQVWMKALRTHQYAKNFLVFVPLLTAHKFDLLSIQASIAAFIAFCACASAIYILNDLIDLGADREHPSKQYRPFASGQLSSRQGMLLIPVLLSISVLCSLLSSPALLLVLIGYLGLTTLYSTYLKRKMIIDVITLALLYSFRVAGGAVAINVEISEWLLAFSTFIFTSLAFIKRYTELTALSDRGLADPSNRNYKAGDLPIVAALSASSGFNAVTIFALYIASPAVQAMYKHPNVLWLICPILMYWFGRLLMMAHRRTLDDDPIVFALKDPVSRMAVGLMAALVLAASV